MMRRAAAVLALALLLVPLAQAATPTGARGAISADNPVNDVAMANTGRFASAGDDPGSRLMATPSAPTWRLWNLDGSQRQTGSIDPPGCPSPQLPSGEDCQTRATRVAVNRDGSRIAVAGQTGSTSAPGDAVVAIFNDAGDTVSNSYPIRVTSITVNAIALDDNGDSLVVAATKPGSSPSNNDGLLGSYGGTGKIFEATLTNPVTAVAINSAGTLLSAAAGYNVRANPGEAGSGQGGNMHENKRDDGTGLVQGNAVSVDVSDHQQGWSVAGYDSGFFAVFSNPLGSPATGRSVQDYQKREASDSASLTAVAIRPGATAFVTGSSSGRLRLYTLDPSVNAQQEPVQPALASTLDSQGAFVDLAFSGDGRYLAARAGGSVRFYDTQGDTLTLLWSDDRTGLAPSVGIDQRGEHVVAAAGSSVIVYDAKHTITPVFPSATQSPGATTTHKLTYRNDGNRADSVQLSAKPPSGVSVQLSPSSFSLKPGASQSVDATVTVPSSFAPGALKIPLEAKLNGGDDGAKSANLTLTIPTVRNVRLETDGATSKGANGGAPALFTVTAANRGNTQESVSLKAAGAPAGWGVVVDPASFTLAPGDSKDVTVSMAPPNGAHDGDAATVTLQRDGGPASTLALTATVGANFQVRLVVPAGSVLHAGASGLVNATVRNEGNAIDSFTVRLGSLPAGWQGGFLNGQSELQVDDVEPGGSRVVQVNLSPPADSASDVPVQVSLTASSLGDASRSSTKAILVTVQNATGSESGSSTHKPKGSPGVEPVLLLGMVALAAVAMRRRRA